MGPTSRKHSVADRRSPSTLPLRTGKSFLERLGILYADQIRLTIVTELYMREMSPKQFFEQIGGTSYDSVRRHFLKLVDHGWLRKVRTEPGGRGRPEQLYRSTELAVIDDETWGSLPLSIRDAFTAQLLEEMGDRFATAVVAGTYQERRDRVLSFAVQDLDEAGWIEAIGAMNACFRTLAEEQTDAKVRLERSGERPILMIVELGGFGAGGRSHVGSTAELPPVASAGGAAPWSDRIAKVFADPLNLTIVDELNRAPMSATRLHEQFGGATLEGFDRRCKALARLGWVTKVESRTGGLRRGATENFYRATSPAVTESEILARVPIEARSGDSWDTFHRFCAVAVEALRAGTFNARPDHHMSFSTLLVDELGWLQVIASLKACRRSVVGITREAERRRSGPGETRLFPAGFLLAGFSGPSGNS